MSKYAQEVVALNKDRDNVAVQAAEAASILAADLEAQIKTQEGVIIRKQSAVRKANEEVTKAQYYLTDNIDTYLKNLNNKWTVRDQADEELNSAKVVLEKLQEVAKIFA
jgi:hypothetical protein